MKQYLDLCRRIVNEGEWVANERTGKRCLTVINADLEYDVANNQFPLITTRKSYWKAAIAEFLGYIRGYDNAADGETIDQLRKIVNNLSRGIDDRGEILTFFNPGEFDLGCLRPCMHTHTFSLVGDKAYHKIVNAHIYEDQLELMRDVQLKREPFPSPQLEINPDIKTLEDLETWVTMDDFKVVGQFRHSKCGQI